MDTTLLSRPEIFTHPGFIGGMIGVMIGLLGGIYGTWYSYRNAKSQKERFWILSYAFGILLFCIGYLWFLLATTGTARTLLQTVYPFFLVAGILGISRHLNRLRRESETEQNAP